MPLLFSFSPTPTFSSKPTLDNHLSLFSHTRTTFYPFLKFPHSPLRDWHHTSPPPPLPKFFLRRLSSFHCSRLPSLSFSLLAIGPPFLNTVHNHGVDSNGTIQEGVTYYLESVALIAEF